MLAFISENIKKTYRPGVWMLIAPLDERPRPEEAGGFKELVSEGEEGGGGRGESAAKRWCRRRG